MANKVITYDVWVGNLPLNADDKNVGKVFSKYGETASMFCKVGKTGDYKYAFIKYFSEADANKAVAEVDGKEVDGKTISVKRDVKQTTSSEDREKARNKRNLSKPAKKPDMVPEMSHNQLPPQSDFRRVKERESVIVTHVENPVTVWIQEITEENTAKLIDLSEQLVSLCPAAPKLTGPVQPGKVYATMFSEDQQWYRCQLKQTLGSETIKVQYIDFGNTEEVKTDHLVEIPPAMAAVRPMATKLVMHNCYAHDLSNQKGIEFLKQMTGTDTLIQVQKTIPLKDNTGHYGILFVGDVCLNELIKEKGFAYTRPAMTTNQKSDDTNMGPMFGSNRNTGSPLSQSFGNDQIIGSGGGYADSGGGGYGDMGQNPMFGMSNNSFSGRRNDMKSPLKMHNFSGNPEMEVEKLRQELAKKNMQLQQLLSQSSEVEILKQELGRKNMQLQQALVSRPDGNQESAKQLQTKLSKKQKELEKTKAELGKKSLLLQQSQNKQINVSQVTELCEQVRNLRCQFPTGQKSGLDDAIAVTLSKDRILQASLSSLQSVVSVMTRYRLLQKEISSCTDKTELQNLIETRNSAREELYEKTSNCLDELDLLPVEERCSAIQEVEKKMKREYEPFLALNVHNNPSLEDLIPSFNDWKVKRESEFDQIRSLTSTFEKTVEQNLIHLSKMIRLDFTVSKAPMAMPLDELLAKYSQLLQQEILHTDLKQTSDASLIAAVVKSIMKELSTEMGHINHFKNLQAEFKETKESIEPWLNTKPNTDELTQIKKTIRGLKSKLRHKEADRQDLVEAGDSADEELEEVKSEIEKIKSELHRAFKSQDEFLLKLAKATSDHFPELFCQFEDLGIRSLLLYNGLVTSGRELDHYTLTNTWKEGMTSTTFAGEPVYLQEYLVGDTDHLDKEMFIKNVARFKEVSCKCSQLPNIHNVFFVKNDRLAYMQMDFPEVMCLQELIKTQLNVQLRQKIIENIAKAVQCLHEGLIVHGEINPSNIGYTSEGQIILLCPDMSKSLEDRLKKSFTADNGLCFRCPEVACGKSAGTKSTDIYCLGLVVLWLYFPSLSIPLKADGYPRLNELQMDPQISNLLYNMLCHPDSRFKVDQVLDSDYIKTNLAVPSSNISDSSTEDSFSTSNSMCSVIENFSDNSNPATSQNIKSVNGDTLCGNSVHNTQSQEMLPSIGDEFPVVSQFDPSNINGHQTLTNGNFINNSESSMELLADCLMKMTPLADLPGLPESDAEISESYQTPEGMDGEAEDEKTDGNISPMNEETWKQEENEG